MFDDNPIFRAGIVHVLNAEPGMEVVMEVGSEADAFQQGSASSPDIVVLDSDFVADKNLWRALVGLCPAAKILVMALSPDQEQVLATFAAGSRGYILKGASGRELLEAIRALHRSEGYVSPALGAAMLANASIGSRMKGAGASPLAQLTFREDEIFNLLAAGLKNREIGWYLDVSEKTIKRYVTRIFEKLHVRNRVEAALLAKSASRAQIVQKSRRITADLTPSILAPPRTDSGRKGVPSIHAVIAAGPAAASNGEAGLRGNGQAKPRGNGHTHRG